jgi:hypothetical protein
MTYADVKAKLAELDAGIRTLGSKLAPLHDRSSKLKSSVCRRWKLDHGFWVQFDVGYLDDRWCPTGLSFCDENGGSPRISLDGLQRAVLVTLHVMAWVEGTCDHLQPNGPWDERVPGDHE